MITEIDRAIRINAGQIADEISDLTPEQLRAELEGCYVSFAQIITRGAMIVNRLRELGEPLPTKVPPICLFVADGRLLPEFAPMIIKSPAFDLLRQLPQADQRQLVEKPHVPVADGEDVRMVNLCEAPKPIVRKVLGPEKRIMKPDEQRANQAQTAMAQRFTAASSKSATEDRTERPHRPIRFKVSDAVYEQLTRIGLTSRPVKTPDDVALRLMLASLQSEAPKNGKH